MNIVGIFGSLITWVALIIGIVMGGSIMWFIDAQSIFIVIVASIGAVVFDLPLAQLKTVPKMIKITFFPPKFDPEHYIEEMVDHCKTARMKGILALEEAANACTNPFMKSSLMLIVDANDSDKVKSMLDDSIDFMEARHDANREVWGKLAEVAPAIGMCGTLIGLVQMLKGMDPSKSAAESNLGQAMSMALITTFYGAILAHLLATPISMQCKFSNNAEVLCMQIIEEGTLAIISGANPRYVEEKLRMMLPATAGTGGKKKGGSDE